MIGWSGEEEEGEWEGVVEVPQYTGAQGSAHQTVQETGDQEKW